MAKKEKKEKKIPSDLDDLRSMIEQDHGDGSVMLGKNAIANVDVFPTGVLTLDIALGAGGIPRGRIIELFGPESSGKTTTCLQIIANCQKTEVKEKNRTGVCAFIDAEHALDPNWAESIGVDIDKMMISQPDFGEQALTIAEQMAESGLIDLIVIDSVAALIPQKMLDGELAANTIGAQAQMMSKSLNRLKSKCAKSLTTIIFVNQIRMKIGVMFGSPEDTPGGRALKFYASVRMDIRRIGAIKSDGQTVANRTKAKIIKNKVAPPFQEAEYDICFGEEREVSGIDALGSVFDVAVEEKIIGVKGSHYSYDGVKLGNGKNNAISQLRKNKELIEEIKEKTYNNVFDKKHNKPLLEQDAEDLLGIVPDGDEDIDESIV